MTPDSPGPASIKGLISGGEGEGHACACAAPWKWDAHLKLGDRVHRLWTPAILALIKRRSEEEAGLDAPYICGLPAISPCTRPPRRPPHPSSGRGGFLNGKLAFRWAPLRTMAARRCSWRWYSCDTLTLHPLTGSYWANWNNEMGGSSNSISGGTQSDTQR